MKHIPISAAAQIAETYGYDQVIIIARKVGDDPAPHGEHCTTYGVDMANCRAAGLIGNFLKHKVMGWASAQRAAARHRVGEDGAVTGNDLGVQVDDAVARAAAAKKR